MSVGDRTTAYVRQTDNTCRWEELGPTEQAELSDAAEVAAQGAGLELDPRYTRPMCVEQLTPGLFTYLWRTVPA